MIGVAAFVLAVSLASLIQLDSNKRFAAENTGRIVLIAASLATLGWSVGALVQIDLNRKKHTTDLVTSVIFSDRYEITLRAVEDGQKIWGEASKNKVGDLIECVRRDRHRFQKEHGYVLAVGQMANYFEVMAVALENDYINHDLIDEYLGVILNWFYEVVEPFAVAWRGRYGTAFVALERYYVHTLNKMPFGQSEKFLSRNPS